MLCPAVRIISACCRVQTVLDIFQRPDGFRAKFMKKGEPAQGKQENVRQHNRPEKEDTDVRYPIQ